MEQESMAMELLRELKHSARRWFIAFIVMVVLEIATVVGFVWYMSLPSEEFYKIEQESTDYSTNMVGGEYNGGTADGNSVQEENN